MSVYTDDRTDEQRKTHRMAVVGTDSFMSGWGEAVGGASYAGWAYKDGDHAACLAWVAGRSDMKRVRLVAIDTYRPRAAHTHIYIYRGQPNTDEYDDTPEAV